MSMHRGQWACALVFAVVAACGSDDDPQPATALVVNVQSDLEDQFASLGITVYKATAELPRDEGAPLVGEATLDPTRSKSFIVYKGEEDDVLLRVRALSRTGQPLLDYATRASFEPGKSVQVPVYLARACLNNACALAPDQTCFGEASGSSCPGSCGAVAWSMPRTPIANPGDEARWQPKLCASDAGVDGPDDAGLDAGVRGGGAQDAASDAGAMCTHLVAGNTCSLWPQCGCEARQGCAVLDSTNPDKPVFGCQPVGMTAVGSSCEDENECTVGAACIGGEQAGYVCRQMCNTDADCGSQGACSQISVNKKPVKGFGACFQRCTTNTDCPTGCCFGAGKAGAVCGPQPLCAAPPPPVCHLEEWANGCTLNSDCCSGGGTGVVRCATPAANDAGVSGAFCTTSCTSSGQCGAGRCCASNKYAGNVCYSLQDLAAQLPAGKTTADYCIP